ncbi:hypothetical protein GCK72_006900 [Caenorhabditis remanei]|uniref:Peptidase M13 C-terminal domain-containing protein n=1 Tax=Caenorhabditis remanei TaxID=31234 RepID=A0A6A5HM87_CAERE|nr:hypothetical protein GCK72_006900 [Caenorhabditis remanei]KAF1766942.1 hypothetical protein GCK72_006900 [Caenorhabditis remanei]
MDNQEQLVLINPNRNQGSEQIELVDQSHEKTSESSEDQEAKPKKVTVSQKRFKIVVLSLIAIIIALLIGLVLAIALGKSSKAKNSKLETCWTKECMGIASMIKSFQKTSVDPCDDFYSHVCGRYPDHTTDDSGWGHKQLQRLTYQIFSLVRKTKKFSTKPNEQLRIFTKKCMDRAGMDSDSLQYLREDIEKRGGFPLIDPDWNAAKFDLSEMLANYLSINRKRMGFLSVEPFEAVQDGQIVSLLFLGPGPHFVDSIAFNISFYKESVAFILERLLQLENRTLNRIEFSKAYEEIVGLEASFVKLGDYSNIRIDTDDMSKTRNLSELAKMVPEIDWFKIMRALPREATSEEMKEDFIKKIRVHGGGEYFFGEERKLARIATKTPKKTLANYIVIRQIIDVALYYYDKDLPKQGKYYKKGSLQNFCSTLMFNFFPIPSMNIFIEQSEYDMENLKMMERFLNELKEEYEGIFNENQYLEPEIRSFLKKKLKGISARFGYPEYLKSQPLLEKMYETLNFEETDTPYQVYTKLWRHRTEQLVEHIVQNTPLNPVHLKMFSLYASYNSYGNNFEVSFPYMIYPWIDVSFPFYSNYGHLAYVVGHEIGHAFDHFHRRLDERGIEHKYWITDTNSSNIEYEKQEKCLRDQYSNYKEPGYDFFMNGTVSRYEIIGDHMGIRAAFRAFKKAQKRETVKLPGFDDATGEQMFFYNYAFRQCDVSDPNFRPEHLKNRPHPTPRYRVNGVVQNIPEFFEAFQCSKNSKMNLETKCKLF